MLEGGNMKHSELIRLLNNDEFEIVELPMSKAIKGLYADNVIAINSNIETHAERICVLAEELGHYFTSYGDILDQSIITNKKQEKRARKWAVDRLIRVEDLIDAFNAGVQNRAELAEFLEVTEDFIEIALDHFKGIYGYSTTIGEYTIIFSPLYVIRKFE